MESLSAKASCQIKLGYCDDCLSLPSFTQYLVHHHHHHHNHHLHYDDPPKLRIWQHSGDCSSHFLCTHTSYLKRMISLFAACFLFVDCRLRRRRHHTQKRIRTLAVRMTKVGIFSFFVCYHSHVPGKSDGMAIQINRHNGFHSNHKTAVVSLFSYSHLI